MSTKQLWVWVRSVSIGLTGLAILAMLGRLLLLRAYNYDELSHAHMAWLVSAGAVPYRDFAANHFPFFWMLISPLMKVLPQGPLGLTLLRVLALTLNLVFISALGSLACAVQPRTFWLWTIICYAVILLNPSVRHFLIEFRPDVVANALLFSSLACLRLRVLKTLPNKFLSGLFIGGALLINTKYLLLPFLLAAGTMIVKRHQLPGLWRSESGVALGFFSALVAGVLLLVVRNIPLSDCWQMVVIYNRLVEQAQPFGFGLAHAVSEQTLWALFVIAGVLFYIFFQLREQRRFDLVGSAILVFLIVNLVTTTRPWKQYEACWFILAGYFPAVAVSQLLVRAHIQVQAAIGACFLAAASIGLFKTNVSDPDGSAKLTRPIQDAVMNWLIEESAIDDFIVTGFPLHPVFRKDTFYKVVMDMRMRGSDSSDNLEQITPEMTGYLGKDRYRKTVYAHELEARPPMLIVDEGLYTKAQVQALTSYLNSHRYIRHQVPGTPVGVLKLESK